MLSTSSSCDATSASPRMDSNSSSVNNMPTSGSEQQTTTTAVASSLSLSSSGLMSQQQQCNNSPKKTSNAIVVYSPETVNRLKAMQKAKQQFPSNSSSMKTTTRKQRSKSLNANLAVPSFDHRRRGGGKSDDDGDSSQTDTPPTNLYYSGSSSLSSKNKTTTTTTPRKKSNSKKSSSLAGGSSTIITNPPRSRSTGPLELRTALVATGGWNDSATVLVSNAAHHSSPQQQGMHYRHTSGANSHHPSVGSTSASSPSVQTAQSDNTMTDASSSAARSSNNNNNNNNHNNNNNNNHNNRGLCSSGRGSRGKHNVAYYGDHGESHEEDDDDDEDDDDSNVELMDPSLAFNFMIEHRIFLRAALSLLTERDRHAPELGMMDPIVLKSGPLKKASHLMNGVWKVKYVEIRRGMFSYYENAVSKQTSTFASQAGEGGELLRKNIPLEASSVTCRAVKLHQKALAFSPTGAIFELSYQNSKRLWMANSREERSVWIQAINNAMVGGSLTRGGDSLMDHKGFVRNVSGRSPFKADLRKYLKVQNSIRNSKTKMDYLNAVKELLNQSLQIPVKWIADQQKDNAGNDNAGVDGTTDNTIKGAFHEETVQLSIDQLWRDLSRDSVSIDNEVYRGDAIHGPERILGSLTKRILTVAGHAQGSRSDLRESQALVYARDILLAGNRTRSAGDAYYCVNTLCSHPDLVVVVPSGTEVLPIEFEVSEDNSDEAFQSRFIDKSGWIKTRNFLQRGWKKLFFVLSEGTLSYYVGALPRPHGLRGQRFMKEATISITKKPARTDGKSPSHDQFIMKISGEDTKDRLLLFESEDKLLDWVYALECVTKSSEKTSSKKAMRRRPSDISGGTGGSGNNDESNSNTQTSSIPSSSIENILTSAEQATKMHAARLGLDGEALESRLATYARRATSAVCVSVSACMDYKVCTLDPEGDELQDTWANIKAHFLQSFRVTGGPNGRIMRGEETVRVAVTKCADPFPELPSLGETPGSPKSMIGIVNRRIFRNFSSTDELGGEILVSDLSETAAIKDAA